MKLLFDQNLSPYLVDRLSEAYPKSTHVSEVGLERALDDEIWDFAHEHGFAIVTKDADFDELSVLKGSPPNVVWVRRGNCTTEEIEQILRRNQKLLQRLEEDNTGVIELY